MRLFLRTYFLIFLLVSSLASLAQNLKYEIVAGKSKLGVLTAEKIQKGAETQYRLTTKVNYSFIVSYKIDYTLEVKYNHDTLVSALSQDVVGGKVKDKTSTVREHSGYQVEYKGGESKKLDSDAITYSIASLYFKAPEKGKDSVYSEKHGVFLTIERLKDGTYKMNPEGKQTNYYTFDRAGKCVEVKVEKGVASFSMKLID